MSIFLNFQVEVHNHTNGDHNEEHDPYFEPVITLPEVHIYSMEEDEEDLVKLYFNICVHDFGNLF